VVKQIPIYISCRDTVSDLCQLVAWLEGAGHERIVLVDNASTWSPLLDYLHESPHRVVHLADNIGPRAFWDAGIFEIDRIPDEPYVVTDPDVLPTEDCPTDLVDHLLEGLDRYPIIDKAGVGLKIDDLPRHYKHRELVLEWESQFWQAGLGPGFFRAQIDTTFAVYRPSIVAWSLQPAARSDIPYLARHLPWYSDLSSPTEEELYYRERARSGKGGSNWTQTDLDSELRRAIWTNRLNPWLVTRIGWRAYLSARYRSTKAWTEAKKLKRRLGGHN